MASRIDLCISAFFSPPVNLPFDALANPKLNNTAVATFPLRTAHSPANFPTNPNPVPTNGGGGGGTMGDLGIPSTTPSLPPSPYPAQMKTDPYIAKRRTANHPCPVCGKHYVNEGSLRKHLACHPETQLTSSLRMWPCSVCQAVFTHESGMD